MAIVLFMLKDANGMTCAIYREMENRTTAPQRGDEVPFDGRRYQVNEVREPKEGVSVAIARVSINEIERVLALPRTQWKDVSVLKKDDPESAWFID